MEWLSRELVLAIHDEQLALFGGGTGLRDNGLLESALARPRNRQACEPDAALSELAAAYAFGIIRNHPFIDGNKRTGLLSIQAFLFLNGYWFSPSQEQEVAFILGVAAGEVEEEELAAWVAANMKPRGEKPPTRSKGRGSGR